MKKVMHHLLSAPFRSWSQDRTLPHNEDVGTRPEPVPSEKAHRGGRGEDGIPAPKPRWVTSTTFLVDFTHVSRHQGIWHYGEIPNDSSYYEYIECICGWKSEYGGEPDEIDVEREFRIHAGLDPRSQDEQAFDAGLTDADRMGGNW